MKDNGWVLSSKDRFAQVEVHCLSSCQGCAAQSLCQSGQSSKGVLTALNPVHAYPGDEVQIDVPESTYSRSLIVIFGSFLLSALIGLFVGYAFSAFLPLTSSLTSLGGLFLGILLAGLWNVYYFRKNKQYLYPKIIKIIKKGASHGSTSFL